MYLRKSTNFVINIENVQILYILANEGCRWQITILRGCERLDLFPNVSTCTRSSSASIVALIETCIWTIPLFVDIHVSV